MVTEATPPFVNAIVFVDGSTCLAQTPQGNDIVTASDEHWEVFDALFNGSPPAITEGTILIAEGTYLLKDKLELRARRVTETSQPLSLVGEGALWAAGTQDHTTTLKAKTGITGTIDRMLDLTDSENIHIRGITFDGNDATGTKKFDHLVYMARDPNATPANRSAGRHVLKDCMLVNALKSCLYNHGSELLYAENTWFQHAPVGAVVSAYGPTGASPSTWETFEGGIIKWTETPQPTGGVHLNHCTLGSDSTKRCGLRLAQTPKFRATNCIFQTDTGAEAYVIVDQVWGAVFLDPWIDSFGAGSGKGSPVAFRVGQYTGADQYVDPEENVVNLNQFCILGGGIDFRPLSGSETPLLIEGKNMEGCVLQGIWNNKAETTIKLRSPAYRTQILNVLVKNNALVNMDEFGTTDTSVQQGAIHHTLVGLETPADQAGAHLRGLMRKAQANIPTNWLPQDGDWTLYRDTASDKMWLVAKDNSGAIYKVELAKQ